MLRQPIEGFPGRGRAGPAFVGDQVCGEVRSRLDGEHQVERDKVERVAIRCELVGGRAAVCPHARDALVELAELAEDDLLLDHG